MNPAHLLFFLAAAAANFFLTPLAIKLAGRFGLMDRPGHRKIHDAPVPKIGGLTLTASIFISVFLGLAFFGDELRLTGDQYLKITLALGVTLVAALLGFLDDLYDIRPRHKLVWQALLFGLFSLFGFRFQTLHIPGTKPLELSFFSVPLTLFWLLAVVNGFNFMDGVDGLAGSVALLILAAIGLASFLIHGSFTGVVLLSAMGAVFSFLFFNWRPAKIYLGDSGSTALGTLIATTLVGLGSTKPIFTTLLQPSLSAHEEPFRFKFLVVSLLVGYPLLEVGLSTLRRASKRLLFGRSMETSEQEHIHHRFLKMGLKAGAISVIAVGFQMVLSGAAVLVLARQNALATWLLVPFAMFLAYLGPRLGLFDFLSSKNIHSKPHYQIANNFTAMQKAKLGLAHSREEVLALVSQTCREFGVGCYRIKVKPDAEGKGGMEYLYQSSEVPLEPKDMHLLEEHSGAASGRFFDFCEIPGRRDEAFWIFESHTGGDELDVEYRVLVSGFMREALEACVRLGSGLETLDLPSVMKLPHHQTSGHHLRKRHSSKFN